MEVRNHVSLVALEQIERRETNIARSKRLRIVILAIAAVMTASLTDHNGERYTADVVANTFAHPANTDPLQDTLIAEVDGTLIGYANTQWRVEECGAACWHRSNAACR